MSVSLSHAHLPLPFDPSLIIIKGLFNASTDSISNVSGGAKLIIGSVTTTAWALESRRRPFGGSGRR